MESDSTPSNAHRKGVSSRNTKDATDPDPILEFSRLLVDSENFK
jgi:hypothetical protein